MSPAIQSRHPGLLACLVAVVALLPAAAGPTTAQLAPPRADPPDLLLLGARVHTLDATDQVAEAVAIRDGHIQWVGSAAEARANIGRSTRVLDLSTGGEGFAIFPGFADSHLHLAGYGLSLLQVDLVGTASFQEVIARVVDEAARVPPGTWILGRGWDQNDWSEPVFPHHAALSAALPDHPAALRRVDGHALLANARALDAARAAGALQWDGNSGRVIHDDAGPTGVFVDRAMALVDRVIPPSTTARVRTGVRRAITDLQRRGVTSIHDAGTGHLSVELFAEMVRAGEFDLRSHVMLSGGDPALTAALAGAPSPYPTDDLTGHGRLAVRSIKLSIDGALGSRGAALLQPYSDEPGHDGLLLVPEQTVRTTAEAALRHGFQLCVHAIGDRGNRLVLNAYEQAFAAVPATQRPVASPRFRVEHAQILHPDDIPRFARLGVTPAMQALHLTSDMPWATQRVGPQRMTGGYAWRSLLDTGVVIPGGTDCPVEVPDPILSFHAAVTRRNETGHPAAGWSPEQRMTRAEAIRHLTLWPAFAAFDEDRLGTIEPGKLADLVVLTGDLLTLPEAWLPQVSVRMTIFDGRVVHDAPGPSLARQRAAGQHQPAYELAAAQR